MKFIFNLFIKNNKQLDDINVRSAYGKVSSVIGIILNVFLFTSKFLVGTMSGSVSIVADSFNNLSDAGSGVIAFISFVYSSKPADEDHPFGHERFEYVSSLALSFLILMFAFELVTSSVQSIFNPSELTFSLALVVVLVISIIVKIYMYAYNKKYGNLINSSVMNASSLDSISDAFATSAVLIALIISHYTGLQLDAYMGVVVAIMIAKAGIDIIKDTLSKILGEAPDPSFIKEIHEKVMSYSGIHGIHDLVVHSYGVNKMFVTLHAEVSAEEDIIISHDTIDTIEKDFKVNENIDLVIHLDPIQMNDSLTRILRESTIELIIAIDSSLSMHDFRVVRGTTHNNLIFDVVVPFNFKYTNEQLIQLITEGLPRTEDNIPSIAVITLDSAYSSSIIKKA